MPSQYGEPPREDTILISGRDGATWEYNHDTHLWEYWNEGAWIRVGRPSAPRSSYSVQLEAGAGEEIEG